MTEKLVNEHTPPLNASILVVGLARDCATKIENEIGVIASAIKDFREIHWLILESDSSDETIGTLDYLCGEFKNFRYITLGNLTPVKPKRTDRIAHCRNTYLKIARDKYSFVDYVLVADLDGVNNLLTLDAIKSCWSRLDWDVCTANQAGPYYDIWALRHDDWSPNDCWRANRFLSKYITNSDYVNYSTLFSKMIRIPQDAEWVPVKSAFGGLAIYKSAVFFDSGEYCGVDYEGNETCEHVSFNLSLYSKKYKIFINPSLINSGLNEHSIQSQKCNEVKFHLSMLLKKIIRIIFKRKS